MDNKAEVVVPEQDVSHPPGTQIWFTNIHSNPKRCWRWFHSPTFDTEACPFPSSPSSAEISPPNDPLNWPQPRRDALLYAIGFNSFLSAALAPILATGFPSISATYSVDLQSVSFTIGIYMLGLGFGALGWSVIATIFGRRPVYVLGSGLLIISSAWAAASPSYVSLLLARLMQGLAAAPGEFLVSVSISEIYSPQERGFRLGIYMLLLAGGKSLSPLVGAGVIQGLGWRWVLW
ncbi:major facilitator superfamily domain-containing protein [Aspergillus multicolor]|uniref:major facilitator superfamily domain-containing protein n=1 Tax=Aspergillus multicolor TaxID=41759 RepID=UPI003CCCFE21